MGVWSYRLFDEKAEKQEQSVLIKELTKEEPEAEKSTKARKKT